MPRLRAVHDAMANYAARVSLGRNCSAWCEFVSEAKALHEVDPWAGEAVDVGVDGDWSEYWLRVAKGESPDDEPATGEPRGS